MELSDLLTLTAHGSDTWVGSGPQYPWGGLYGGQIMAQGLLAASQSVDAALRVHSLHAYFIRSGDASAPIRFEVDRIRNGRTFATRRVVARQASGAILNMSASFHAEEAGTVQQTREMPDVPAPDSLPRESWSDAFDRRPVPAKQGEPGRVRSWFRANPTLPESPVLHACALAFMSDDTPAEALLSAHPEQPADHRNTWMASLDHAMWFHQPMRADRYHLHDFDCHGIAQGRGLSIGHVFSESGEHVATVAQEVLSRPRRGT